MQTKLYYIFDPLCGWCFGFSPVIKALEKKYKDKIDFEVLSGGMVLGDNVKPLSAMHDYLRDAMPRLEEMTGVKFGEKYMEVFEEGSLILDSELPCIAMLVFKSMSQKSAVQFASALQQALYVEGKDLKEPETYKPIVESFGLPWEVFSEKLQDPAYKQKTYDEFAFVQKIGISGFPSVIVQQGEEAYLIARGYRKQEEMEKVIEEILQKEEA